MLTVFVCVTRCPVARCCRLLHTVPLLSAWSLFQVGSYTETCDIEYSNILRVMVEHMGSNGRGAPMLQVCHVQYRMFKQEYTGGQWRAHLMGAGNGL